MSSESDRTLADVDESALLARIFPLLPNGPQVCLGPGDDTAQVAITSGKVLITTDTMVLGRDWLDEWSSGQDVGAKCVAQNVADIAAMGGVCTAIVATLVADPATPLDWAVAVSEGMGAAAGEASVAVVGGDLSSAPEGLRAVSITAIGELPGPGPVLRSGARVGDVVAVSGPLGRAAAGLLMLQRGMTSGAPVDWQRRPRPEYADGPAAAAAGATAMLDVSDGLVRDAGRIAAASGVTLALDGQSLQPFTDALTDWVGPAEARDCVLAGGEEHVLLATYPGIDQVPAGWTVIGRVDSGDGVRVDGIPMSGGGWDHFAG